MEAKRSFPASEGRVVRADEGVTTINRRRAIIAASSVALAPFVGAATRPNRLKPQPGDILVHAFGSNAGTPIAVADVVEPLAAFPMEPANKLVRDGSLHNQLTLVRTPHATLSAKAQRFAVVAGAYAYLAYSAACTHTGCEVNGWNADAKRLVCPCHGSEFDVADAARVVHGPAPKPLAMLQVALDEDLFQVVGGFSRRVGPEPV